MCATEFGRLFLTFDGLYGWNRPPKADFDDFSCRSLLLLLQVLGIPAMDSDLVPVSILWPPEFMISFLASLDCTEERTLPGCSVIHWAVDDVLIEAIHGGEVLLLAEFTGLLKDISLLSVDQLVSTQECCIGKLLATFLLGPFADVITDVLLATRWSVLLQAFLGCELSVTLLTRVFGDLTLVSSHVPLQ